MFVPEYDVKNNRVDDASYDVLYKKSKMKDKDSLYYKINL